MNVNKLYEILSMSQAKIGYYFNRDRAKTKRILIDLLANKTRYGYMVCPCRLAAGIREEDQDIICPCEYREADVLEFGCCYCKLYVAKAFRNRNLSGVAVPERRPDHLMHY